MVRDELLHIGVAEAEHLPAAGDRLLNAQQRFAGPSSSASRSTTVPSGNVVGSVKNESPLFDTCSQRAHIAALRDSDAPGKRSAEAAEAIETAD